MQRHTPRDIHAVDGERSEIEPTRRDRPLHTSLPVEAYVEREAVQRQHAGAPFAAHQRAEVELDVELVGADLGRIAVAADGDRPQPQRRGRQQQGVELAADTHRRADDAGGFRLELRTKLVPIDEIRPDQRCDQRENEGNRQSEQRGLQGFSSARDRPMVCRPP